MVQGNIPDIAGMKSSIIEKLAGRKIDGVEWQGSINCCPKVQEFPREKRI